jgi:transposase
MVRDRGVSITQAACDLDRHITVLRNWESDRGADPSGAFRGHGQMQPGQLEIDRLRRENAKLEAKRDI